MSELEYEERPWGNYQVLEDSPSHKVKRITVTPGQRLSYQRHQQRAEHWYVVSGQASVTLEDVEHTIDVGHAIDIPRGSAHRVANRTKDPLVLIEVQVGDYFGEEDIERIEDDYGRGS
ncbi:phosphomannose isomerase type II C-terminal cupin domain [bacterium]|mgnify:FL=1|jgi:mannose-6-phosphate isomerase-like protein (cupin superfamily)|nr:phosphomannose isomerase type II C-terminal cupin domain [bacterium]